MLAMLPLAVRGKTMQVKPSRKLGRSGIALLLSFGLLWTIFVALALTVATTLAMPIAHLEPDHIEGWQSKMAVDLAVKTIDLPGPKWVPAPVDIRRRNDSNESGCVTVNGRRLCNNDHPGKGCQLYPSRKCAPPSGGGSSGGGGNNGGGGGDGNTPEVSAQDGTTAQNVQHVKHLDVTLLDGPEAASVLEDRVYSQSKEVDAAKVRTQQHPARGVDFLYHSTHEEHVNVETTMVRAEGEDLENTPLVAQRAARAQEMSSHRGAPIHTNKDARDAKLETDAHNEGRGHVVLASTAETQ